MSRRQFLVRATAVLGSTLATNTLLAACTAAPKARLLQRHPRQL